MVNKKNYLTQPIYITLVLMFLLSLGYFLPETFDVAGVEIKRAEIFSKLLAQPEEEEEINSDDFFNSDEDTSLNTSFDQSISYASIFNTLEYLYSRGNKSDLGQSVEIQGNTKQLKEFFNALKNSKKKKIRIAHFGDSIIEGDLVSSQIREELQTRFGGLGVGFVPITSQDVTFRQSMKISFSKDWKDYAVFTSNPESYPVGMSGEVFLPEKDSWVKYETARFIRRQSDFSEAYLYFQPESKAKISYDDGRKEQSFTTNKSSKLKVEKLDINSKTKSLKIEVPKNSGYYFGVSLEGGNGVYVDNYPLRGNSGVALNNIPVDQLKQFSKELDYDLILLEFGVNALNRKNDYRWYEKEMLKVVENLQKAFPKAGIILMGVHDKSRKKGSTFVSEPGISKLLKAQMSIVKDSKIAFWDLQKAMGGKNSMPKWVNANPPLAFMDYTHFNDVGAKVVAELFVDALLKLK